MSAHAAGDFLEECFGKQFEQSIFFLLASAWINNFPIANCENSSPYNELYSMAIVQKMYTEKTACSFCTSARKMPQ